MIHQDQPAQHIERKLEQLQTLIQVGQILDSAATLPESEILQLIYEQVAKLMDATNFYVAFYDPSQDMVGFGLAYEGGVRQRLGSAGEWSTRKLRRGFTEWIIYNKRPVLLVSEQEISDWVEENQIERFGRTGKSWLGVPMFARNKILGVMAVQSYSNENFYDQDDLGILGTFAAQSAIAIDNARLLESQRRRAHELDGLLEAGRAITQLTLDLGQVLERIVNIIPNIIRCDYALIFPFDERRHEFDSEHITTYGVPPDVLFDKKPSQQGTAAEVLRKELVVVSDTTDESLTFISRIASSGLVLLGVRSLMGVRLDAGEETVGVLFVDFTSPRQFTDDEIRTVQIYAHQAAIAIHNARLFEREVEERIHDIEATREIEVAIGQKRPLADILGVILKEGAQLIGATHGSLALVDRVSEDLAIKATLGPDWTDELRNRRLKIGVGITGRAVQTCASQRIPNVERELNYVGWFPDVKSELAVPLIQDGECLGVVNFHAEKIDAFTLDDERLIESFAAQVVIAMRLAGQYDQLEHARAELEALHNVDKAIIESVKTSHDLDGLLQFILEEAMKVTKSPFGNIMWHDPFAGALVMRAQKGVTNEFVGARQRVGEGIIGLAAQTKMSVSVADVTVLPWANSYAATIPGIRSELAVPVIDEANLLAVINVENPQPNAYGPDDQRLLEALAQEAVIAIQNIERYEQMKKEQEKARDAERLAMLGAVSANFAHRMGNDVGTIPSSVIEVKRLLPRRFKNRGIVQQYLDRIEDDARSLIDTAEKLRRPYKPNKSEVVDVNALVKEALDRVGVPKRIQIEPQLYEDSLPVSADVAFLIDAFKNVIDNAVHAMPNGGKLIVRSRVAKESGESRVEIEFEDTGSGIMPADLERIFDLFFSRKKGKGLGFGLWWCKMFLHEIGGDIRAFSEPGKGATFRIYLPLRR